MQDTLATLGDIQADVMPDSRYVLPRRLTFQQAGEDKLSVCLVP